MTTTPARLTVLAGPTAVGKGTVSADVRARYPQVWLSVSATTRSPRPGEVDGVHYRFVSEAEFDRMVAAGEVDCCIGTGSVAHALGLELVPLVRKNYQLVVRRSQIKDAPIQAMLQTLSLASFRREVEAGTGYSMRNAGERLL